MVKNQVGKEKGRSQKAGFSKKGEKGGKYLGKQQERSRGKKKEPQVQQIQQQMVVEEPNAVDYGYTVGHLEPTLQMEAMYTGGKIIYNAPHFYSSCEYKIFVWDHQSTQIVARIEHEGEEIVNFSINSSASILATYTSNNLLRLLSISNKYEQIAVLKLPHYFPIDMEFSPNEKFLALGCVNSHLKILSVPGLKETHDHKHHSGSLRKIEWHPTQLIISSIDENKMFIAFDVVRNRPICKIEDFGNTFGQTKSGNNVIGVGDHITVLDKSTFKSQYRVLLEEDPETMCIFGKEPYLLFPGKNQELKVMDLNDPSHQVIDIRGLYQGILMKIVPLSSNSFALISSEQNIYTVTTQNKSFVRTRTILAYNDEILDIKFSKVQNSDPNVLAMATNSSLIKIYNTLTKQTKILSGHKEIVLGLSFAYPWLVSGGKDNVIKLWKFESSMDARLVATYKGHSADVTGVALALTNFEIVSVSEDKTIKLWKMFDFEEPKIVKNSSMTVMSHDKAVNSVKWSPDEQCIASCSQDKLIKIWSKTLELKFVLKGHRKGVWDICFHPNEKILASVSADGSLKIWNLSTGECVSTMGEGPAILKAQWLFNNQVATSTADGILKIWDIRKSTFVLFDNHEGRIWAMDISVPNSEHKCTIVTAGIDSKILVWEDKTTQKVQELKAADEKEERTKLTYQLAIDNKDYAQAAKLAFKEEYHQLFVKALEHFGSFISEEVVAEINDNELIFVNHTANNSNQLEGVVMELMGMDIVKLLKIVQNLNGISRYFKISNRILNYIFKNMIVDELLELQGKYYEEKKKASLSEFNKKESDFQEFLARLQSYNQSHSKRLDTCHKRSYWMDYQSSQRM